ncbi:hypothetical protein [Clostridium sp.]|uniref:hypothetical protein n=1 Tax=Clostridium sp. TaxID=1506 RepID=UPI001A3E0EFB|nr:hypothetical protein [Clostridium sp.]MBK5234096.1 hypothetical protein [Clostridium sp.]
MNKRSTYTNELIEVKRIDIEIEKIETGFVVLINYYDIESDYINYKVAANCTKEKTAIKNAEKTLEEIQTKYGRDILVNEEVINQI